MKFSAVLRALVLVGLALVSVSVSAGKRVTITVLMEGSAKRSVSSADIVLAGEARIGRFTAVRIETTEERAAELAREPGVKVWPWVAPRMHDERSGQIVAGAIDSNGQLTAPGYVEFLASRGITSSAMIDITDSGFDKGSTTDVPPELANLAYARDFTFDNDPHDVSGHGTLNASISAGSARDSSDPAGYDYALGVAPGARIGSSRIFRNNGIFDVHAFYNSITAPAWRDGARVSNNSWGSPGNIYTPDSIEYDALVRDADPDTPGDQPMTIVFSAGNAGPGGHIETPGDAKNVITVGAAEGLRSGTDGCEVGPTAANSALDIAFFSAGGPVQDGRIKPDLVAPGTHIAGTRSRADGYNASGVCAGGFPGDRTQFTWSSGTSHAAPAVSGAAALLYSYLNNPSPALIKAWLLNSTRYLTGEGANDDLPSPRQGWGLLDLGRALDDAPRVTIDQTITFNAAGQSHELICTPTGPVRITLVWTDAPGDPGTAPQQNDIDLEVESGGVLYHGNYFDHDRSIPGGSADTRNNVESVWLPATTSPLRIRIRARELLAHTQDFALVAYNVKEEPAALLSVSATTNLLTITNTGSVPSASSVANLTSASGVTVPSSLSIPSIAAGESITLSIPISIDQTVACGASLGLHIVGGGLDTDIAGFANDTTETVVFDDDVESTPRWTFHTDNRGATWSPATDRVHSGTHSWHAAGSTVSGDSWIESEPIAIPSDAIQTTFSFWHTFSFERGFDGGVVEVSAGGPYVDAGVLATEGGYSVNISNLYGNTLGTRPAWTGGNTGPFSRVSLDLTGYAGRTIRLRLRIGADAREGSAGWWVDDLRVTSLRTTCVNPSAIRPVITSASYKKGKLKIKGTGFSADTQIFLNGREVTAPVTFNAAKGVLKVRATSDALRLRLGSSNALAVTTARRVSAPFGF